MVGGGAAALYVFVIKGGSASGGAALSKGLVSNAASPAASQPVAAVGNDVEMGGISNPAMEVESPDPKPADPPAQTNAVEETQPEESDEEDTML